MFENGDRPSSLFVLQKLRDKNGPAAWRNPSDLFCTGHTEESVEHVLLLRISTAGQRSGSALRITVKKCTVEVN